MEMPKDLPNLLGTKIALNRTDLTKMFFCELKQRSKQPPALGRSKHHLSQNFAVKAKKVRKMVLSSVRTCSGFGGNCTFLVVPRLWETYPPRRLFQRRGGGGGLAVGPRGRWEVKHKGSWGLRRKTLL